MGTMAQADAKAEIHFKLLFTIIQIAVILVTVSNAAHTYFHEWYVAAPSLLRVIGLILHVVSILWLWFANKIFVGGVGLHPGTFWLAAFALALPFTFGFNCF